MKNNPTEQTVQLALDGEKYELFFDLETIAAAEDVTGLPLITGIQEKDVYSPRISLIRAMLWAALQPKWPGKEQLTLAQASKMVTQFNCREIWAKVLETWAAGMRKPKKVAADPPQSQS